MPTTLTFSTLGAFQVRLGAKPLSGLSGGKMSALLVYLAMNAGHKYRRETLAELFWPDLPSESARFNLRHIFFHLRQALGGDTGAHPFVLSGRDWLGFNPESPFRMDAIEFVAAAPACVETPSPEYCEPCITKMEHMVSLYRGEFMAEFSLPECPEFEDWLQVQREAMRRHAVELLERLSDCHEQSCAYTRALPFALRYTDMEPWNEEAHRRAMRLFALDGQGGAALAQYDTCCRVLKKELGVLPGENIRNLAERIRKGELRPGETDAKGKPPMPFLPPLAAERHQVTVLYCELTPLEIEDMDSAMAQLRMPQKRCINIIRNLSGHLVQFHGGGLLAYFGYPKADENAAHHAVQAALACVQEAATGLEVRVGVHTGLIVTSSDLSVPDTIGLTSGLAIRLRLEVKSGEVAISSDTHRLVTGYFSCKKMGRQQLRGAQHPLEVFKVKEVRAGRNHTSNHRMDKQFATLFTDSDRIACRIAEDIAPRIAVDQQYQKARKNTPNAVRTDLNAAIMRIAGSLLKDDAEFYKQLAKNESFRQFVAGMVIKLENLE